MPKHQEVLKPVLLCAVRRSSRARAAPEVYKPAWVLTDQGRITSVDELDETREGDEFQAALPDVRPRPGATPADELPWMQPPIPTGEQVHS